MKNLERFLILCVVLILQVFLAKWIYHFGFTLYTDYIGSIRSDVNYGVEIALNGYIYILICLLGLIFTARIKKNDSIYLLFLVGYIIVIMLFIREFTGSFKHPYRALLAIISAGLGMFVPLFILHRIVNFFIQRFPNSIFLKSLPFGYS
jgi:hypothetical protein